MIAKAGKPMVNVVAYDGPSDDEVRRIGFMEGSIEVPDDLDRMGADEIEKLFGADLRGNPDDRSTLGSAGVLLLADRQAVLRWIALNEETLVDYWEFRIDTDEFFQRLKPLSPPSLT